MNDIAEMRKVFDFPSGDRFKFDNGKPRCDLVPPEIIEAIGAVRTYGVQTYGNEYSDREVEAKRYRAALMRHICSWLKNPYGKDEESGLPHLWHVACNVAFLIELDKEKNDDSDRIRCDAEEAEADDINGTDRESCG